MAQERTGQTLPKKEQMEELGESWLRGNLKGKHEEEEHRSEPNEEIKEPAEANLFHEDDLNLMFNAIAAAELSLDSRLTEKITTAEGREVTPMRKHWDRWFRAAWADSREMGLSFFWTGARWMAFLYFVLPFCPLALD